MGEDEGLRDVEIVEGMDVFRRIANYQALRVRNMIFV